jgi:hypothetical protein
MFCGMPGDLASGDLAATEATGRSVNFLRSLAVMRADRLPPRGMFIVPHGAPEGYEWFVALVVLVGLYFAVRNFMRARR